VAAESSLFSDNTIRRRCAILSFWRCPSNVMTYLLTVTSAFIAVTWRAPRRHVTRHVISAYLLHSVVESLPVGVAEEPSCGRLDEVDDLIDGHERKTHAVCQLTSELLAIGAIKVHPPYNRLHAYTYTLCC